MNIILAFISFLTVIFIPAFLHAETVKVITKENAIREQCRFFAPIKLIVHYDDELTVITTKDDWFEVRFGNIEGCIHKSAVEKKAFSFSKLMAPKTKSATEEEVALAGKGFNPQVERSYRNKHPQMNFYLVDRIEKYRIPEGKVMRFINNGGLRQPQ